MAIVLTLISAAQLPRGFKKIVLVKSATGTAGNSSVGGGRGEEERSIANRHREPPITDLMVAVNQARKAHLNC
ncbi:hypothetical protein GWI33_011939 [Rhynchophorus ferrugineus]|uniref:Uncharacterized protein n=1 Tax=Rhynchophorus ferrugineus TaxID=354439 RepID=A0A834MIK9_RHYFE|nr:hypothetical protein GWI33_011939 [Rhynchophorus ferrugineus]